MPRVTFKTERPFIFGAIIAYALIWKLHNSYYTPIMGKLESGEMDDPFIFKAPKH